MYIKDYDLLEIKLEEYYVHFKTRDYDAMRLMFNRTVQQAIADIDNCINQNKTISELYPEYKFFDYTRSKKKPTP